MTVYRFDVTALFNQALANPQSFDLTNVTRSAAPGLAPGDTVVVYVTGEGQTSPKGVTGKVTTVSDTPPLTPAPVLAVAVVIGGQPAQFSFAMCSPLSPLSTLNLM